MMMIGAQLRLHDLGISVVINQWLAAAVQSCMSHISQILTDFGSEVDGRGAELLSGSHEACEVTCEPLQMS